MSEPLIRICGLPDSVIEEASWARVGRSPDNPLLYAALASIGDGIPDTDWYACLADVYAEINKACAFFARQTDTARSAHCRIDVGPIDKVGGTLAWSELANGFDTPCRQKVDSNDNWGIFAGAQSGKTDLYRVMLHETLHLLGFGHQPKGSGSILEPYYSPNVRHLTDYDVRMLQRVYGPPINVPPPLPPPAGSLSLTIEVIDAKLIRIPGYKLVKE